MRKKREYISGLYCKHKCPYNCKIALRDEDEISGCKRWRELLKERGKK